MPSVYNGCGTWYYGKGNLETHTGTCRYCGRVGTLKSYDTTLFVVVVFIPIIPLSRKRIIEECAACRRHSAAPLKVYREAHDRLTATAGAYEAVPGDVTLATEAIRGAVTFRDLNALNNIAPKIEEHLGTNVDMLLMLAAANEQFGRISETERLSRRAVELGNSPEAREMLAQTLMNAGKLEEAETYMQHVIDQAIPDRVDLVYRLAQHYQARGNHDKALEAFEKCVEINPAVGQNKSFIKLREASIKRRGTSKPVKLGSVAKHEKGRKSLRRLAVIMVALLAVGTVVYLSMAVFLGMSHRVYVVNGLGHPYSVKINGTVYELPAQASKAIRVGEGDVSMEIVDAPPGVSPTKVSIHTPFLTRPIDSTVYVVNPDEAALVELRTVFYSSSSSGTDPQQKFSIGQPMYSFGNVNFPFEEFPKTISMDSHELEVERTGLLVASAEHEIPEWLVLLQLADKLGHNVIAHAAIRHVLLEPQETSFLRVASIYADNSTLADALKPGLDIKPARMQWHRAYQQAMSADGKDEQLEKEYTARLAADPTNTDLIYLAGRANRDFDTAQAQYLKAVEGPRPCTYAFYSLCNVHMDIADYPAAVDWAEKALASNPNELDVQVYARQALLAAGNYTRAAELARQAEPQQWAESMSAFEDEIYALAMSGDRNGAQEAIERCHQRVKRLSPTSADEIKSQKQAMLTYVDGNSGPLVKQLAASEDPSDHFASHLYGGDLESAEHDLEQLHAKEPDADLLLYIAALRAGKNETATNHWNAALSLLNKGEYDNRSAADALLHPQTTVQSPNALLHSRLRPAQKAIVLTAAMLHDPALHAALADMAQRLNFDRRPPYLLLRDAQGAAH